MINQRHHSIESNLREDDRLALQADGYTALIRATAAMASRYPRSLQANIDEIERLVSTLAGTPFADENLKAAALATWSRLLEHAHANARK